MILYNKDKKAYVNYVEQKLRSDIVTDISLASELTEAQAKALLRKCTSKLKGFKIVNRSQFQPHATTAAAVILNASKSAFEAKPEPPSEPEPQNQTARKNSPLSSQKLLDAILPNTSVAISTSGTKGYAAFAAGLYLQIVLR